MTTCPVPTDDACTDQTPCTPCPHRVVDGVEWAYDRGGWHDPAELQPEQWRPYPLDTRYEVSDLGRVRSLCRREPLILAQRGGTSSYPYRCVSLSGQRAVGVHSLVMQAFVGPRPDGLEVRHLNGDPTDNRLVNLAYGTRSENQQDRIRHGRNPSSNKTHCVNGHEFTPETCALVPNGGGQVTRRCLICRRANATRRYRAKKGTAR